MEKNDDEENYNSCDIVFYRGIKKSAPFMGAVSLMIKEAKSAAHSASYS